MGQAQRKIETERSDTEQRGALPFAGGSVVAPSPARLLQDQLASAPAAVTRWPVGQRVALIVSASLALWTAILHLGVGAALAVA